MKEVATVEIFRSRDGYRFRLRNQQNREIVGAATKSYPTKEAVIDAILQLTVYTSTQIEVESAFTITKGKNENFYFKIPGYVRSEGYTQKHNAIKGIHSLVKSLGKGLITCHACEDSSILNLADMPQAAIERGWFEF